MSTEKKLRMCIDRALTEEEEAIARLEAKKLDGDKERPPMRIGVEKWKLWTPKTRIRIGFLEGDPVLRDRVFAKAKEWEAVVSVRFERVDAASANIRIAFDKNAGSWSNVGRECLGVAKGKPTMNYGWLDADTDEVEYSRTVLHEFGHALGCIHEHQSPQASISWNEAKVYEHFAGSPNWWSEAKTKANILDKYQSAQVNSTRFDRDSIMIYAIPSELLLEGEGFSENTQLSEADKTFMRSIYP